MDKKKPVTLKKSKDNQLAQANYNPTTYLFKAGLYLLLGVIYVPMYCGLILTLPLLPTRLADRLVTWLAADQGGV